MKSVSWWTVTRRLLLQSKTWRGSHQKVRDDECETLHITSAHDSTVQPVPSAEPLSRQTPGQVQDGGRWTTESNGVAVEEDSDAVSPPPPVADCCSGQLGTSPLHPDRRTLIPRVPVPDLVPAWSIASLALKALRPETCCLQLLVHSPTGKNLSRKSDVEILS